MRKRIKLAFKVLLVIFWVAAGINHFVNPEFYTSIMPDYFPIHLKLVYLSGITEIAAGLLVAIPQTTRYGVWLIYAHLAVFMTVHIHMLYYASTRYADIPVISLWIRLPIQALFALWAYGCTKPETANEPPEPDADEQALAA
jgi:uncharacterized membrane protein